MLLVSSLPHDNPCAQCAKPIRVPSWIEAEGKRRHFLWHCDACGYRFQTTAIYRAEPVDLAA